MTFIKSGFSVVIISSTLAASYSDTNLNIIGFNANNLNKSEKIFKFKELLERHAPDIIICCEPLPVIAAHKYKKSTRKMVTIISDITEWYPENVALKLKGTGRLLTYIKLFLFNIYATNLADRLIIGEKTKYKRYKFIAPFRRKEIIGYYPVLDHFHYSPPPFNGEELVLCYAGVISFERGILNILNVAIRAAEQSPHIRFVLKIIGRFQYDNEEMLFLDRIPAMANLSIDMVPWGKYEEISHKVANADICLDLRNPTFVYRNSLPIKIFEYMACGKPVIYSDIAPVRKELSVDKFGFLVDPENTAEISDIILNYIKQPELLLKHSKEARLQAEKYYNWGALENKLVDFVTAG